MLGCLLSVGGAQAGQWNQQVPDLFNLGSPGVEGNNIVTNAYGLKYKPNRNLESGVAWEFPLTERRGVLDNRLTVDLILRY